MEPSLPKEASPRTYGTPQEILRKMEALLVQMSEFVFDDEDPYNHIPYGNGFRSSAKDALDELRRFQRFPKEEW